MTTATHGRIWRSASWLFTRRRTDEAVEEFQRALALNPNFAAALGYLGLALAFDGRSDQAIENIDQAMRMSPHDPQNSMFNMGLAVAHYLAGRYAEAVGFGRKSLQQRDGLITGHRIYIASLAQAGQIDEARASLQRLKELQPNSLDRVDRAIRSLYARYDGEIPRRHAQSRAGISSESSFDWKTKFQRGLEVRMSGFGPSRHLVRCSDMSDVG